MPVRTDVSSCPRQREYPTAAAIARLTEMLHLPPGGQDWEIMVADAPRVGEFLDTYERQPLDDDERFTLMELIVASYDDLLRDGGDADGRLWERPRRHLLGGFDLHGYTVQYWSLPDEDEDPDHVYPFTAGGAGGHGKGVRAEGPVAEATVRGEAVHRLARPGGARRPAGRDGRQRRAGREFRAVLVEVRRPAMR
jgi:hypothetical protein